VPDIVRQSIDVDADLVGGLSLLGLLAAPLYFFVEVGGVVGAPLEFVQIRLEV
jgi:hypothetical protein